MSGSQNPWRPDDAAWLAQRKAEWGLIKRNLDRMTLRISKRAQQVHKEFFFYGSLPEPRPWGWQGGDAFDNALPLFEIWYHPALTEEVVREIYKKQVTPDGLVRAREFLFLFPQDEFATAYGMLGGREHAAVKLLFPGLDWKEERIFPKWGLRYALSQHPYVLCMSCLGSTGLLLSRKNCNPFAPGQYLWDHLDFAFEHYKSDFEEFSLRHLNWVLWLIADFDVRETAPRDHPPAAALRERLFQRFVARGFGPVLMSYWDKVRTAFESGAPAPETF